MSLLLLSCAFELIAPACPLEIGAIERYLCIELESTNAVTSTTAVISFADAPCDSETLTVKIREGAREKQIAIPLADVAIEVRPRTVALSILEALRAPETIEPYRLEPIEILSAKAAPEAEPPPIGALFILAASRFVPKYRSPLFGARAGVQIPVWLLSLTADVGFLAARKAHALGDLKLDLIDVAFGARIERTMGPIALSFGPRLELGWAWASGSARQPATIERSGSGPVVLAGVSLLLTLPIAGAFGGFLEVEGAGALRGFDTLAASDRALGISGILIGASVGLALAL